VDDAAGAGRHAAGVLSPRAPARARLSADRRGGRLPGASGSLGGELLNALLGCVLVYSALFGVGQLLLRSAAIGMGLLVVSALAAFAIARNLTAQESAERSASGHPSTS
jgi:hypothetical protein